MVKNSCLLSTPLQTRFRYPVISTCTETEETSVRGWFLFNEEVEDETIGRLAKMYVILYSWVSHLKPVSHSFDFLISAN